MKRYVTRAYIADDCAFEEKKNAASVVVIENNDVTDTGLLDASGVKIYRVGDRVALGFLARS